jgi:ribose transport system substrate-binding protein
MKVFRILSTILVFAMLLSVVNLAPTSVSAQTPAPAKPAIANLAPATLTDSGQIVSFGPDVKVDRTGQEPPPTKKKTPIKVGFTPTAMNTHYDIVIAGAKQAIEDLGGPSVIDMVIQAPSSQSGTAEQMNIVEGWVEQGFDAIAICTANDQAMTPIYKKAAEKGIPVFVFNTPVPMSVNPYYVSNVGYDQAEAGRLIGLWLVQNFGAKPTNLAILEGLPGVHNEQRLAGFKKAIEGTPNIKVVASQPADWVRDKGQTVMENMLTANSDINVVWGMYDEMALGGLAAIKAHNLVGKIAVMGYDNTPDANQAIKRGEMSVTVDTAPKEMGYDLIQAIKKYVVDGEMVPKVINCEIAVWDQSNIAKFDTTDYTMGPMPKKTGAAPAAGATISDTTK